MDFSLQTGLNWLYIYPEGIHLLLKYVKAQYKNPTIYITENGNSFSLSTISLSNGWVYKLLASVACYTIIGMAYSDNSTQPIKEALKDGTRIRYHHAHLASLLQAIKYE